MAQFPKYIPVDESGNVLTGSSSPGQSSGVISVVNGLSAAQTYGAASADNTAINQTVAGVAGKRWHLQHLVFSYSARPPAARQALLLVDGSNFWTTWITEAGAGPVILDFSLAEGAGFQLILPASGQAGILGDAWIVAGSFDA